MKNQPEILTNYCLQALNTFRVPAKAEHYVHIDSTAQLQALLKMDIWREAQHYVLGEGSNTLFINDYDGLVLNNTIKGIGIIKTDADATFLKLGAGENWHQAVIYAISHDLHGIENLSLIPGTVGAAPIQNIGAYGAEIKDVIHSVEAVNVQTGEIKQFDASDCEFAYRDSIFKNALRGKYIITSVTLKLWNTPHFNTSYHALQDKLKELNITELSLKNISDVVIAVRQSKLPDPKIMPNAGSFFKNPIVNQVFFEKLQQQYPHMPHYDLPDNHFKIPAGWLIETCGWKGKRVGKVGVHDKQALVLVNHDGGTGQDIYQLSQAIQADVNNTFGIQLIPEVNIL